MLSYLPKAVFDTLIQRHLSSLDMKTLRLVSKECKSLVDASIVDLRPRDFSTSQERELVIFFTHLEDLELRQSSQVAHWEVKSRIEQLTALSELKTLKLHWDQKYNLLHDVQAVWQTLLRLTKTGALVFDDDVGHFLSRITTSETLHFDHTERFHLEFVTGTISTFRRLEIAEADIITKMLVNQVAQLKSLQELEISAEEGYFEDIRPLSGLTNLTYLSLPNLGIADPGLNAIRSLKHLRYLSLDHGRISDSGLCVPTALTALRSLSLQRCRDITAKGLKALVVPLSRQSLAHVDVTGCLRLPFFTAKSMGVICCAVHSAPPLGTAHQWQSPESSTLVTRIQKALAPSEAPSDLSLDDLEAFEDALYVGD